MNSYSDPNTNTGPSTAEKVVVNGIIGAAVVVILSVLFSLMIRYWKTTLLIFFGLYVAAEMDLLPGFHRYQREILPLVREQVRLSDLEPSRQPGSYHKDITYMSATVHNDSAARIAEVQLACEFRYRPNGERSSFVTEPLYEAIPAHSSRRVTLYIPPQSGYLIDPDMSSFTCKPKFSFDEGELVRGNKKDGMFVPLLAQVEANVFSRTNATPVRGSADRFVITVWGNVKNTSEKTISSVTVTCNLDPDVLGGDKTLTKTFSLAAKPGNTDNFFGDMPNVLAYWKTGIKQHYCKVTDVAS